MSIVTCLEFSIDKLPCKVDCFESQIKCIRLNETKEFFFSSPDDNFTVKDHKCTISFILLITTPYIHD